MNVRLTLFGMGLVLMVGLRMQVLLNPLVYSRGGAAKYSQNMGSDRTNPTLHMGIYYLGVICISSRHTHGNYICS
ncbi:hypothetical protein EV426DRAFT_604037 [Tirmania nivea]|nr:hypothetical protein EV426DRAFT_604037 [Tirmania nivea]